jgi:hypothetical protein
MTSNGTLTAEEAAAIFPAAILLDPESTEGLRPTIDIDLAPGTEPYGIDALLARSATCLDDRAVLLVKRIVEAADELRIVLDRDEQVAVREIEAAKLRAEIDEKLAALSVLEHDLKALNGVRGPVSKAAPKKKRVRATAPVAAGPVEDAAGDAESEAAPAVPTEPDTSKIRQWARGHGYVVADRGRLPSNIVFAYEKAHAGQAGGSD